jgi:hypothetical protein
MLGHFTPHCTAQLLMLCPLYSYLCRALLLRINAFADSMPLLLLLMPAVGCRGTNPF